VDESRENPLGLRSPLPAAPDVSDVLEAPPASPPERRTRRHVGRRLTDPAVPTVRYLFSLESHVYAFAIAANVLLSFFPFMVLVLSIAQNVFRWRGAADVIYVGLRDYLPQDPGLVQFVVHNLRVAVEARGAEALSAVMLVFSSNGIFVPLEVALNRLWGFPRDRSYWRNQLMSLALTFACGLLALGAAVAASASAAALQSALGGTVLLPATVTLVALKLTAVPFSVLLFLLIYWALPNGPVPLRRVLPIAVLVGLVIEVAKNVYLVVWPHLGFRDVYGPFFVSMTLLMWGYVAAMIVLAAAELSARRRTQPEPDRTPGFQDPK
jgi:membrane protein/epoxyqueuosine reductase